MWLGLGRGGEMWEMCRGEGLDLGCNALRGWVFRDRMIERKRREGIDCTTTILKCRLEEEGSVQMQ